MFILENHDDDSVLQYGLTTAYDVSTAALSKSFDLTGSGATNADAFEFNSDGTITVSYTHLTLPTILLV